MKKRVLGCSLILALALTMGVSADDSEAMAEILLSQSDLLAITLEQPLVVSSEGVSITISQGVAESFAYGEGDVVITLSQAEQDALTEAEQVQMGVSDLYLLSVTCDGSPLLGWGDAPITISLPYEVTEGTVQVWQLSQSLKHRYGLTSSYGYETGTVTFQTNESGYIAMATNPFSDVSVYRDDYLAILWAYQQGIVSGTDVGIFSPDGSCTRAMIATVLWRMSGEADWGICYPYADVEGDQWYTDGVYWCTVNGIVSGYGDETFRPDVAITREELVSMLYRYAQYLGVDVTVGESTNILSYTDAFDISDYAFTAIQWACGADVMEGDGTDLFPQREATRGELVSMLMRIAQM